MSRRGSKRRAGRSVRARALGQRSLDRLHRAPADLSLQEVGDAGQGGERLGSVSLEPRICLAQAADLPAELSDVREALAPVGHGAAAASLVALTMLPPLQYDAENRAEQEADRQPPEPDHGIDGAPVRLDAGGVISEDVSCSGRIMTIGISRPPTGHGRLA